MRAAFLDRDGVLNHSVMREGIARAPYTLSEFRLMPGVPEGIGQLKENGFLIIVVTNQPDVARGWVDRRSVEEVNLRLKELISYDDLKVCFHTEKDNCDCRKPRPGMILESAAQWNVDLTASFMVGDRYSDIEAGRSAGCRTILLGPGDDRPSVEPDFRAKNFLEAVDQIISS